MERLYVGVEMINKNMTIKEILNSNPELVSVFNSKGLRGFDNELILSKVGINTLETVLTKKNINVELFVDLLNETAINQHKDVTLNNNFVNTSNINVVGLLPCPVRIPLMETLNKYENIKDVNFNLKAASEGLDWLKESVGNAKSEEDLADMYISAGFDLFFDNNLMKKFKDANIFKDLTSISYNDDFNNDYITLKDPNNDYSMISIVPAVFLVNKKVLGDRPMPKRWEDLFNPIYKGSISLPVSDFDLFNAVLIHIYKDFGTEGVRKLKESMVSALHPAQMVKSYSSSSRTQPAISVMPYFFTKMAIPGGVMEAVWPEDGAIVSPIFMLTKQSKKEYLKPIADLMVSKKVGEILSHQGLFPSVNSEVNNDLGDKKLKWIGWEYINSNNIGKLLQNLTSIFNEGEE